MSDWSAGLFDFRLSLLKVVTICSFLLIVTLSESQHRNFMPFCGPFNDFHPNLRHLAPNTEMMLSLGLAFLYRLLSFMALYNGNV